MLDTVFMEVLDATRIAGLVILVVLAARLLLRKAPKAVSYALWAVVLLRLFPVSITAPVSVMPAREPVAESYTLSDAPVSVGGASVAMYHAVGDALNGGLDIQRIPTTETDESGDTVYVQADWWEVLVLFGQYAWLAGMAVMAGYSAISYGKLRRKLIGAVRVEGNLWVSDYIATPFVMGLFRPKIYLPSTLSEKEREYILLHERYHIKRGDHLIKAVSFLALCVHWFNPLVWVAFVLSGKDMEMSCDEAVIRAAGEDIRADYSASLLSLATGRRIIAGTPLAFGEGNAKGRIRNLLHWKKPAVWVVVAAVVLSAVLGVCLLVDPQEAQQPPSLPGGDLPVTQATGTTSSTTSTTTAATTAGTTTTAVSVQPAVLLTRESASAFIEQTLNTLTMWEDGTVTFSLPQEIPKAAEGGVSLAITLNATYSSGLSQSLLDYRTGWRGGQTYRGTLPTKYGELSHIMLRVSFRTWTSRTTIREYMGNYVYLRAPFDFGTPAAVQKAAVQVSAQGTNTKLLYTFQNGKQARLSLTLPEGYSMQEGCAAEQEADPPMVMLEKNGEPIGTLWLYRLGTDERDFLQKVDTAKNELPMTIFSWIAISNHAGYDEYTVRRYGDTGAAATALYWWQDLTDPNYSAAAAIPHQTVDCVLAYDWAVMPYFAELIVEEATPEQLIRIAESIRITAK